MWIWSHMSWAEEEQKWMELLKKDKDRIVVITVFLLFKEFLSIILTNWRIIFIGHQSLFHMNDQL